MEVTMCLWMLLLVLSQRVVAGPLGKAETEREPNPDEDLNPARSGGPVGRTRSPSRHLLKDVPCAGSVDRHRDALPDLLLALKRVWSRKDSEETERKLRQFGFCSRDDPQVSSLITRMEQEGNNSLEYVHSKNEHWHVEDEVFTLTLHFVNPGSCYRQTQPTSMMLLFFIDSCFTDPVEIEFSGRVLQPNNQTLCVSQATCFLMLQTEPFSSGHVKLSMAVRSDSGKEIALAELQTVMYPKNSRSKTPAMVLFPRGSDLENISQSNKNFLFLCELQNLLNEVSPPGNPLLVQDEVQAVSPGALHSLPPLTLGVSSSESLLSELVNSSGPTVFYFPQSARLRTHRVELALTPSLVSVLRSKLDLALARVRTEAFGHGVIDKLQLLSVLSALPEKPELGVENQREVQYRALLLLKTLQAVLDARAVDRAQRAARADHEGLPRLTQCHLESFTVSLEKYLLEPSTVNINNCEGACSFPLANGNNHAILLNSHLQSGQPLNRTLCCVPVAYDDLCVIELHSNTTMISYKTDMVAKECGCR